MGELDNCAKCDKLFVRTPIQDVCPDCYKEEQKLFESVYDYIRKKENRTATLVEVSEATKVEETLIIKWIRMGKLKLAQFPNLGYPCEKCKTLIRQGRVCDSCARGIQADLRKLENEERLTKENRATYLSTKRK